MLFQVCFWLLFNPGLFWKCFYSLLACALKQRVKRREDHDDSIMFEELCAQLYVLATLKRIYLVIHLNLSKDCLCLSFLCRVHVSEFECRYLPRVGVNAHTGP